MNITTIAAEVILDKNLPNGPFKLYCILAKYAGMNFAGGIPLDNAIIEDTSLSDCAFRVYCVLAIFAHTCPTSPLFLAPSNIGSLLGRSEGTIRKHLKTLIKKGIIEEKRYDFTNGLHDNYFVIHDCIRDKKEL